MYVIHEGVADPDSPVGTAAFRNEYTDGERVEFHPETGKAQVRADVGEGLCEQYDDIRPAEAEEN